MSNYVNKIKKDNVIYDINDSRLDEETVEQLLSQLTNPVIKAGYYIWESEIGFKHVEVVPEDYTGYVILINPDDNDAIFSYYECEEGALSNYSVNITASGFAVIDDDGQTIWYDKYGAEKLNFENLTHSFDDLDATLKALCESAIASGDNGVSCTHEQWDKIKSLLDNSLYFYDNGYSMIKSYTDGISIYFFGSEISGEFAEGIRFLYDSNNLILYIKFYEI